jgi:hypothetical protein
MCVASVDLSAAVRQPAIGQQTVQSQYNTRETEYTKHTNKQGTSTCWIGFLVAACFLLLVKLPVFFLYAALDSSHAVVVPKKHSQCLLYVLRRGVFGNFQRCWTMGTKQGADLCRLELFHIYKDSGR